MDICAICLEIDNTKTSIITSCGHRFHLDCLKKCKNNECPLCRTEIEGFNKIKNLEKINGLENYYKLFNRYPKYCPDCGQKPIKCCSNNNYLLKCKNYTCGCIDDKRSVFFSKNASRILMNDKINKTICLECYELKEYKLIKELELLEYEYLKANNVTNKSKTLNTIEYNEYLKGIDIKSLDEYIEIYKRYNKDYYGFDTYYELEEYITNIKALIKEYYEKIDSYFEVNKIDLCKKVIKNLESFSSSIIYDITNIDYINFNYKRYGRTRRVAIYLKNNNSNFTKKTNIKLSNKCILKFKKKISEDVRTLINKEINVTNYFTI